MDLKRKKVLSAFKIYQEDIIDVVDPDKPEIRSKTLLRKYQADCLWAIKEEFEKRGTESGPKLLVLPTGSGKSGIISLLPYVVGSSKVMVLSPSVVITNQLANDFGINGLDESFYSKIKLCENNDDVKEMVENNHVIIKKSNDVIKMDRKNLVIVNAQKFGGASNTRLYNKNEEIMENVQVKFANFDTLIVDEAHHYPAQTWKNIVELFCNKKVIFLTATKFRGDGEKILPDQEIVYEVFLKDLRGDFIRDINFIENPNNFKLVYQKGRKLTEEQVTDIGRHIHSILDKHDEDEPSIKHKAMVLVSLKVDAETFSRSDLIENATYFTSDRNTDSNKSSFENGTNGLRILFICGRLLEGYDNSDVSVCVILRKVRSMVLFTQFVGRCLRKSNPDDKVPAVVLSYDLYEQKCMYKKLDTLAEDDPQDEDDIES